MWITRKAWEFSEIERGRLANIVLQQSLDIERLRSSNQNGNRRMAVIAMASSPLYDIVELPLVKRGGTVEAGIAVVRPGTVSYMFIPTQPIMAGSEML